MRVNVGLVASSALSKAWSRPLTKCVFPAPRSPASATTSLGVSDCAHSRAKAMVSATLLEVNVAMERFSIFNFQFSIESTNPSERKTRKFFAPLLLQRCGIVRRKREEQLVIFSIIDRLGDRAPAIARQRRFVDLKTDSAGF